MKGRSIVKKNRLLAFITAFTLASAFSASVFADTDNIPSQSYPTGPYDILHPEITIVYAEDAEGETTVIPSDPIQTYSYFGKNTYNYYDGLSSAEKSCYDSIRAAIQANPGTASCRIESTNYNNIKRAFFAFVHDYPEYVATYSFEAYIYSSYTIAYFEFCDGQSAATADSSYKAVVNTVNNITAGASKYSSNYDKLLYLAHYLCDNVQYDYDAASTMTGANDWNAYGSLINGLCVCEGYAEGFKLLCDKIQVPCITVVSNTHEWNQVYMDGAWYIVDVTWMDSYGRNGYYDDSWFMIGSDKAALYDQNNAHVLTYDYDLTHPLPSTSDYDPASNPGGSVTSPDDQQVLDFVERLYTKMLNRASDPSGKENWYNRLKSGSTAAEVASRFVLSDELRAKNISNKEFVTRMYRTFMDREPDADGLNHWIEILDNGCSYAYVLNRFAQSNEFNGICSSYGITAGSYSPTEYRDQSANLTAFISRMYTKALNRKYDVDGLNHWTGCYINKSLTINEISYKFIFSAEFKGRNLTDEQFVTCMYSTFFDRAPDAGGKAHWLEMLSNGGSREDVLAGFLRSQEFKNLVKSFGLSV